jgi:general secretion pathway protein E
MPAMNDHAPSLDSPVLDVTQQMLGELLVHKGLVAQGDVERALEAQLKVGGRIGSLLMRAGALSEDLLLDVLAEQLEMPIVGQQVPEPTLTEVVTFTESVGIEPDWLLDQQVVVWQKDNQLYHTAMDILSIPLSEGLEVILNGAESVSCLSSTQVLSRVLGYVKTITTVHDESVQYLIEMAEEAPTIELVNNILAQAADADASDVHIEPEEDSFKVRYRVDGVLHTRHQLPLDRFAAVVSRIKLISNIDISERRLPQDGRFSTRSSGQEFEIRVSSLPGVNGESLVLRLLPKQREEMRLDRLGLLPDHYELMTRWMHEPHGIVLVTGPTGSGKSTTLHAAIDESNDGIRKIITVEDPVEFKLQGITQVQAHSEIGLTFAAALRSILRQDPDVVLVGEIRDLETAEMAIQASMTGHLVLSTIHTNEAISAFSRLIDMGIEPFLVATPIVGVQAQRLVRRVCTQCSVPAEANPLSEPEINVLEKMLPTDVDADWRDAKGCSHCNQTGYRGRIGIYELIEVTDELQEMILTGRSVQEMRQSLVSQNVRFMREDGLLKARAGLTTVEEVMRITSYQEQWET